MKNTDEPKSDPDAEPQRGGEGSDCAHLLGGRIECGYVFDDWLSVQLVDPFGYKADLLLRLHEWVNSYGRQVSVRYWVTDAPTSFNDAQEGFVHQLLGGAVTELEANEYSYSEWTNGVDYDSKLKVGGHDLMQELSGQKGKFAWVEFSSPNVQKQPRFTRKTRSASFKYF